ncbi:234_t:CDS:2 [Gigaspora margarita]|uniref:234_t:CDS:1 n=1 Tax=Gigaspora margarita TaxID=4874 RepID=A0ABN7WAI2_GIGMA|nr:234_t:CDS:2 [Gigaspora margarita]
MNQIKPNLIYPPEGGVLYDCNYLINGRSIKRLIISNHYKQKHSKYMSDEKIIKFIADYLDGENFYNGEKKGPWEFFTLEPIFYENKKYKLIWLLNEEITDFLGVVNCCYKELEKVCKELSAPGYPRSNVALPQDASPLDRSKYSICKRILLYKQKNNLPVEELAQKINLTIPEVEDILFARINRFTLDRLVSYVANLLPIFELQINERRRENSL